VRSIIIAIFGVRDDGADVEEARWIASAGRGGWSGVGLVGLDEAIAGDGLVAREVQGAVHFEDASERQIAAYAEVISNPQLARALDVSCRHDIASDVERAGERQTLIGSQRPVDPRASGSRHAAIHADVRWAVRGGQRNQLARVIEVTT
jgi:hypothetical protein